MQSRELGAIDSAIASANTIDTVFQIVESMGDSFTEHNLVMAFCKLANLSKGRGKKAFQGSVPFKEMVLTAVHNAKMFTPEDMANIMCALGHIGVEVEVAHLDYFAVQFVEKLRSLTPNVR